ncbi:MAG: type II secretion system F family protein, partial [Planctomycetaceae bacterium]|nr:type II secretion system F family protein [Planctomycetaceae bacterium]
MVSLKNKAEICHRLGLVTGSGISLVDAIKREASRQRDQKTWSKIVSSLEEGDSLANALKPFTKQFGEMFVALIETGEDSGSLSEMFIDLAKYYDDLLRIRHDFLRSLILPVLELVATVVIVGLVILLLGFIREITGSEIDILGFGLVGVSGFLFYCFFVGTFCAIAYVLFLWMRRSMARMRFAHYFLNNVPKVGLLMRTLAFMRLCWCLDLTMRTGMEVERALTLSFNGVNYAPVSDNL